MTSYVADEFLAFGSQKTVDEYLGERHAVMLKRVSAMSPEYLRNTGVERIVESLVKDSTLDAPEIDFEHPLEPVVVENPRIVRPSLPTPPGNPSKTLRYGYQMKSGSVSDLKYMPKVLEGTPLWVYRTSEGVAFDVYKYSGLPTMEDQIRATKEYRRETASG